MQALQAQQLLAIDLDGPVVCSQSGSAECPAASFLEILSRQNKTEPGEPGSIDQTRALLTDVAVQVLVIAFSPAAVPSGEPNAATGHVPPTPQAGNISLETLQPPRGVLAPADESSALAFPAASEPVQRLAQLSPLWNRSQAEAASQSIADSTANGVGDSGVKPESLNPEMFTAGNPVSRPGVPGLELRPALGNNSSPDGLKPAEGMSDAIRVAGAVLRPPETVNSTTLERLGLVTELSAGTGLQLEGMGTFHAPGPGTASPALPMQVETLPQQIVQGVRFLAGHQGGTVQLNLHPPALGTLRIRLDLSEDRARGWIRVSSPTTHELLQQNVAQLRRALENHGIQLESLAIRAESDHNPHPWSRFSASGFDSQGAQSDHENPEQSIQHLQSANASIEPPENAVIPYGDLFYGWDLFA